MSSEEQPTEYRIPEIYNYDIGFERGGRFGLRPVQRRDKVTEQGTIITGIVGVIAIATAAFAIDPGTLAYTIVIVFGSALTAGSMERLRWLVERSPLPPEHQDTPRFE